MVPSLNLYMFFLSKSVVNFNWMEKNVFFLCSKCFLIRIKNKILFCYICRCSNTHYLLHISVPVCTTTLRDTSSWVLFRAHCVIMAYLHKCPWCIQYHSLESKSLSSSFTLLHVKVLQEDQKTRLDVFRRDFTMHNR